MTSAATPSRCWSARRAVGSQPERCRSAKLAPVSLSSSGRLPAAATSAMAIGFFIPGTTNRSPRRSSVTRCGAWSRYAGSMFAV